MAAGAIAGAPDSTTPRPHQQSTRAHRGMLDEAGPVAFTWWHAAFYCKACSEVVASRRAWETAAESSGSEMAASGKHGSVSHWQMDALQHLFAEGRKWRLGTPVTRSHEELGDDLMLARKLMATIVSDTVDGVDSRVGSRSAARKAAFKVACLGLEVLRTAERESSRFNENIRARVKARRVQRDWFRRWRTQWVADGPARAAAVARVNTALSFVWTASQSIVFAPGAGDGNVRVWRAYMAMRQRVDSIRRPLLPVHALLLRVLLIRWRGHADALWDRWPQECWARARRAILTRGGGRVPWPGGARHLAPTELSEAMAMASDACGHAFAVPWEEGGFSGRRLLLGDRYRALQAADVEGRALRAFWRAGGHGVLAAERRVEMCRHDARMVANIARLQGGDRLHTAAAEVVRWLSQVAPGRRGNGVQQGRRMPAPQRRTLDNALIAAGLACDKRKRWPVGEVVEWRGRTLAAREARVRWKGFDPSTGEPWADTWEPLKGMTADLQEEGRLRPKRQRTSRTAEKRAVEVREVDDDGRRRKSPRIRGEMPRSGLA